MDGIVLKVTAEGHIPEYQTEGAAGMDLHACVSEPLVINPGKRAQVSTGLCIELPVGYEAQVRARSGLAAKHGIGLVNGIGTIDSDYRGEIKIWLINLGEEPFTINNGDRVAQLVVAKYVRATVEICDALSGTDRGDGGFGHTGR